MLWVRDNKQIMHIPTYPNPPFYAIIPSCRREAAEISIEISTIAMRLRKLRREKGWSQQELAERCRFPGPWKVSRLEGGKKGSGISDINMLEIVCRELGIEVWELLKPDPSESSTVDDKE